ncbi:MAG: RNA 2',3'-cyclic phosphodiesterase [Verrucomicrobia bacterium]|nr:MAG: RNA 2',3'-cyclic phosphodiesterase [Verrucomicrobiota bacterium]
MTNRLFVAIDLPESTRQLLAGIDPQIRGVRWVDPAQMHLTLSFFGDVPDPIELALREKLSGIEFGAFFLPIAGVGTFSVRGAPKIIWIGVGKAHPHLFQIHKRVQEAALAAGLEPELKPWHPHITLARCRDVSAQSLRKFLQSNAEFDAGMIRVEDFHLYSSRLTPAGPIHTREFTVSAAKTWSRNP